MMAVLDGILTVAAAVVALAYFGFAFLTAKSDHPLGFTLGLSMIVAPMVAVLLMDQSIGEMGYYYFGVMFAVYLLSVAGDWLAYYKNWGRYSRRV